MQTTNCPACNSDVIIEEESFEGDPIDCPNCAQELEIISLHPLQVASINDEEEIGEVEADE